MKYRPSIATLLFFVLSLLSINLFAWNALGHLVIANIAYQKLQPNVREKIDQLVTTFQTEYPDVNSFPLLADWMDTLHSQKIEVYSHWHYIDNAFSLDDTPLKNLIDTDNAVWAINTIEPTLTHAQTNIFERARFLAFLSHIVADLHQPLHTVSLISTEYPDGDKGGNSFSVTYQGEPIKLHQLWDEGVGAFEGSIDENHINTLANAIMKQFPESNFATQTADLNPNDWAQEGLSTAKQFVYQTPKGQPVSATYIQQGKTLAGSEAALAGYRLANLLNKLFNPDQN